MKNLLYIAVVMFGAYLYFVGRPGAPVYQAPSLSVTQGAGDSDAVIADAFANHESNVQVSGEGVVTRLLPDDNSGSRHQRFIIRLASGQTLLVAHNIDLAPKISSLLKGDTVQFYGEYEWNERGGVLHWTHRDPQGRHAAGWLQHEGRKYQ